MPKPFIKFFLGLTFLFMIGYIFLMRKNDRTLINEGLASIKTSNVFIYDAPFIKANKIWKLNHPNWPVIILETSKNWVKIVDAYNTTGWIKKSNISTPYALALQETYAIKNYNNENSKKVAKLLANASVPFVAQVNEKYCKIIIKKQAAYVPCVNLFYKAD
jgi:SH3-like domain-containing protein